MSVLSLDFVLGIKNNHEHLQVLKLGRNGLDRCENLYLLSNLMDLDLSHNRIQWIHSTGIQTLHALRKLNLSYNNIRSLDVGQGSQQTSSSQHLRWELGKSLGVLESLDLCCNQLGSILPSSSSSLPPPPTSLFYYTCNLRNLKVGGNPLLPHNSTSDTITNWLNAYVSYPSVATTTEITDIITTQNGSTSIDAGCTAFSEPPTATTLPASLLIGSRSATSGEVHNNGDEKECTILSADLENEEPVISTSQQNFNTLTISANTNNSSSNSRSTSSDTSITSSTESSVSPSHDLSASLCSFIGTMWNRSSLDESPSPPVRPSLSWDLEFGDTTRPMRSPLVESVTFFKPAFARRGTVPLRNSGAEAPGADMEKVGHMQTGDGGRMGLICEEIRPSAPCEEAEEELGSCQTVMQKIEEGSQISNRLRTISDVHRSDMTVKEVVTLDYENDKCSGLEDSMLNDPHETIDRTPLHTVSTSFPLLQKNEEQHDQVLLNGSAASVEQGPSVVSEVSRIMDNISNTLTVELTRKNGEVARDDVERRDGSERPNLSEAARDPGEDDATSANLINTFAKSYKGSEGDLHIYGDNVGSVEGDNSSVECFREGCRVGSESERCICMNSPGDLAKKATFADQDSGGAASTSPGASVAVILATANTITENNPVLTLSTAAETSAASAGIDSVSFPSALSPSSCITSSNSTDTAQSGVPHSGQGQETVVDKPGSVLQCGINDRQSSQSLPTASPSQVKQQSNDSSVGIKTVITMTESTTATITSNDNISRGDGTTARAASPREVNLAPSAILIENATVSGIEPATVARFPNTEFVGIPNTATACNLNADWIGVNCTTAMCTTGPIAAGNTNISSKPVNDGSITAEVQFKLKEWTPDNPSEVGTLSSGDSYAAAEANLAVVRPANDFADTAANVTTAAHPCISGCPPFSGSLSSNFTKFILSDEIEYAIHASRQSQRDEPLRQGMQPRPTMPNAMKYEHKATSPFATRVSSTIFSGFPCVHEEAVDVGVSLPPAYPTTIGSETYGLYRTAPHQNHYVPSLPTVDVLRNSSMAATVKEPLGHYKLRGSPRLNRTILPRENSRRSIQQRTTLATRVVAKSTGHRDLNLRTRGQRRKSFTHIVRGNTLEKDNEPAVNVETNTTNLIRQQVPNQFASLNASSRTGVFAFPLATQFVAPPAPAGTPAPLPYPRKPSAPLSFARRSVVKSTSAQRVMNPSGSKHQSPQKLNGAALTTADVKLPKDNDLKGLLEAREEDEEASAGVCIARIFKSEIYALQHIIDIQRGIDTNRKSASFRGRVEHEKPIFANCKINNSTDDGDASQRGKSLSRVAARNDVKEGTLESNIEKQNQPKAQVHHNLIGNEKSKRTVEQNCGPVPSRHFAKTVQKNVEIRQNNVDVMPDDPKMVAITCGLDDSCVQKRVGKQTAKREKRGEDRVNRAISSAGGEVKHQGGRESCIERDELLGRLSHLGCCECSTWRNEVYKLCVKQKSLEFEAQSIFKRITKQNSEIRNALLDATETSRHLAQENARLAQQVNELVHNPSSVPEQHAFIQLNKSDVPSERSSMKETIHKASPSLPPSRLFMSPSSSLSPASYYSSENSLSSDPTSSCSPQHPIFPSPHHALPILSPPLLRPKKWETDEHQSSALHASPVEFTEIRVDKLVKEDSAPISASALSAEQVCAHSSADAQEMLRGPSRAPTKVVHRGSMVYPIISEPSTRSPTTPLEIQKHDDNSSDQGNYNISFGGYSGQICRQQTSHKQQAEPVYINKNLTKTISTGKWTGSHPWDYRESVNESFNVPSRRRRKPSPSVSRAFVARGEATNDIIIRHDTASGIKKFENDSQYGSGCNLSRRLSPLKPPSSLSYVSPPSDLLTSVLPGNRNRAECLTPPLTRVGEGIPLTSSSSPWQEASTLGIFAMDPASSDSSAQSFRRSQQPSNEERPVGRKLVDSFEDSDNIIMRGANYYWQGQPSSRASSLRAPPKWLPTE